MRYLILFLIAFFIQACASTPPEPTRAQRFEQGKADFKEAYQKEKLEDVDPYIVGILEGLHLSIQEERMARKEDMIRTMIDEARAQREEATRRPDEDLTPKDSSATIHP